MKATIAGIAKLLICCASLFGLFGPAGVLASEGNIDPAHKYARPENGGWLNFRPTHSGVTVHDAYLSGYAWAENVGWVKLGSGAGPYANTNRSNWGVNHHMGTGALSGYAWSENAGWINFNPKDNEVTIDPGTGAFDGYAWAENVGWIHFKGPGGLYGVAVDHGGGPVVPISALSLLLLDRQRGGGIALVPALSLLLLNDPP